MKHSIHTFVFEDQYSLCWSPFQLLYVHFKCKCIASLVGQCVHWMSHTCVWLTAWNLMTPPETTPTSVYGAPHRGMFEQIRQLIRDSIKYRKNSRWTPLSRNYWHFVSRHDLGTRWPHCQALWGETTVIWHSQQSGESTFFFEQVVFWGSFLFFLR